MAQRPRKQAARQIQGPVVLIRPHPSVRPSVLLWQVAAEKRLLEQMRVEQQYRREEREQKKVAIT